MFLSCYNLLLQFLYYKRGNKQIRTVESMLSCGALERSNNPYIELIVVPCFSKNQNLQNFLQKTSFFLYLIGHLKNGEGNQQKRRRKYMRKVTKSGSKN